MALIIREPVVEACIDYGRAIEHEIREYPETEITDDRLEELCEPLLKRIKTDTENKIRLELEEEQARQDDAAIELEHEENLLSRKSNVIDTVIINIMKEGEIQKSMTKKQWQIENLLKRDRVADSIKHFKKRKATCDAEDKSEVLEHSTDDEYWDDCKTHIDIELKPPFEEFIGMESLMVLELINKHANNVQEMLTMLTQLQRLAITKMYSFELDACIKLLQMVVAKENTHQ